MFGQPVDLGSKCCKQERIDLRMLLADLHWADPLLLDFVEDLLDSVGGVPLLVVATARPELTARRPDWEEPKPNRATLALAPLSHHDTGRPVRALLEEAVLPAELQSGLLARASGNPLHAEEYVRMLADRGLLDQEAGARGTGADELPLPETVQGIIAARLDALSQPEKALLQDASVLGEVCWSGALAAVGNADLGTLSDLLGALEGRQLLRPQRPSRVAGEQQYAFSHVLVRDVAYNQLPRAARADRQRRAAEWLQALAPDRTDDRADLLAYHYQSALNYAQATRHGIADLVGPTRLALSEAGRRAADLGAFAAAGRWYAAALEPWPENSPESRDLLLRLGAARLHSELAGHEELSRARDAFVTADDGEGRRTPSRFSPFSQSFKVRSPRRCPTVARPWRSWRIPGPRPQKQTHLPNSADL